MRRSTILLKKLRIEGKEFVTSDELKRYCKSLGLSYKTVVNYFIYKGYLTRIFRGIFYVKTLDEVKLGTVKYNHLELVAKGLELKGVKIWYFGLYTALKLNNMTHEYFAIDYVINDKLYRSIPINIAGYKFKFVKLTSKLLKFGVNENALKYSNAEKTILDFIYTWKYNGVPKEKIILDISEWSSNVSKERIIKYANNYPKTVRAIVDTVIK